VSATEGFGEYAFATARVRWEAEREIDRLEAQDAALWREWSERTREIRHEIWRLRDAVHPADFKQAMLKYPDRRWKPYWRLVDAGIASFEEAALKTTDELLAIEGIGPKGVEFIGRVLEEHGYALREVAS
jgi:hypothetical protein